MFGVVAPEVNEVLGVELHDEFVEEDVDVGSGLIDVFGREELIEGWDQWSSVMACWMSSSGRWLRPLGTARRMAVRRMRPA
jgi:hypothetical protein